MWKNNNILTELQSLAPTLAKLSKKAVFKVPSSFFENNKQVWNNLNKEVAIDFPKTNNFTLPENYFVDFPAKLQQTIANLDTDEAILNKNYKSSVSFSIPKNYFEQFEDQLMAKLEDQAATTFLNEFEKENNFKVPANYFEQFNQSILANVQAETVHTLDATNEKEAFNLPSEYFKNFESRLKERIAEEENTQTVKETKVIPLNPNRASQSKKAPAAASEKSIVRKITQWGGAIAAMMTLFVGINIWFGNAPANDGMAFDLSKELKKLESEELRAYVLSNEDEFDEEAIFAAKGVYDESFKLYNPSLLNQIDKNVLKVYYEEEIL